MKKLAGLVVVGLSWLMFISMLIYLSEIIFDFNSLIIEKIFTFLKIERERISSFLRLIVELVFVVTMICFIRFIGIKKKRRINDVYD